MVMRDMAQLENPTSNPLAIPGAARDETIVCHDIWHCSRPFAHFLTLLTNKARRNLTTKWQRTTLSGRKNF